MKRILSNKLREWLGALIRSLIVPIFLFSVPKAVAEDLRPWLTGACTPHTPDQGPWDCKATELLWSMCLGKKTLGYDPLWKLVRNDDDAAILLKAIYSELNDPSKFLQWLSCQGVHTYLGSKAAGGFRRDPGSELIWIRFSYPTKKPPYPVSWLYFLAYGTNITIQLDDFGQIKEIEHDYSVE